MLYQKPLALSSLSFFHSICLCRESFTVLRYLTCCQTNSTFREQGVLRPQSVFVMTCKGCLLHPAHREFVKVRQKSLEWPEAAPSGNHSSVFRAGGSVAPRHLAGNMWSWWQHVCAGGDQVEWDTVTRRSPYVNWLPRNDTEAELFGWPVPFSQQNKPTNILSAHGYGI